MVLKECYEELNTFGDHLVKHGTDMTSLDSQTLPAQWGFRDAVEMLLSGHQRRRQPIVVKTIPV